MPEYCSSIFVATPFHMRHKQRMRFDVNKKKKKEHNNATSKTETSIP